MGNHTNGWSAVTPAGATSDGTAPELLPAHYFRDGAPLCGADVIPAVGDVKVTGDCWDCLTALNAPAAPQAVTNTSAPLPGTAAHVTTGFDGTEPVCSCGRLGYAHRTV